MEEESFNFDHFLIKETNKENVFFDILSSNEDNRSTGDLDVIPGTPNKESELELIRNKSNDFFFDPNLIVNNSTKEKEEELLKSKKALSTFSDSDPYLIKSNTEETKPKVQFKTEKPKKKAIAIPNEIQKVKEKRKDYYLKLFKVRCGKYIIKTLNSYSKLHFYSPDSKLFTSNVKYESNRQFLKMTIKDILLKYDKLTGGSNEKTIMKLNKKDKTNYEIKAIQRLLHKTYEEVIRDYIKDQQFLDDLNALLTSDEKNYYYMLGFDEQNNFINVMKTSKGNQRH